MPPTLAKREYQRITAGGVTPVGEVSLTYLVAALEIVVQYESGAGLLLRLHSYPQAAERPGYLAAPSLQMELKLGAEAEVGQREFLAQVERRIELDHPDLEKEMEHFAESFGLRRPQIRRLSGVTLERKPPISGPERHSAYATVRFRVEDIEGRSIQNLLDPEGRHGFVVLPLDQLDVALQEGIDPDGTEEKRLYFLGKPLISALDLVVRDPGAVARLRDRPIDVQRGQTRRTQNGLIACADIAGYGEALSVRLSSLLSEHVEERGNYRRAILGALETALAATGTTQIQSAGDGFVAGYPCSTDPVATQNSLRRVIDGWTGTLRTIAQELNPMLIKNKHLKPLGSRIAVAAGEYTWGRVNGLSSFFPAFDGDAIIAAARMEQALRNGMYASSLTMLRGPALTMETSKHYLAVTAELADSARGLTGHLRNQGWTIRGSANLWFKERTIRGALILEWNSGGTDG